MAQPIILHIETATPVCSVCISAGGRVLAHQEAPEDNQHSSILGPFIAQCLEDAGLARGELHAVSVSAGPGSYTGLRVGASTAKGICYALGIPLIAIDTLEAAVLRAVEKHEADVVIPMIDARRMEVYAAVFDGTGKRQSENEALILTEDVFNHLLTPQRQLVLCGNGTQKAKTLFKVDNIVCDTSIGHSALHHVKPSHRAYLESEFADIFQFVPAYLKPPNITKPKKSIF